MIVARGHLIALISTAFALLLLGLASSASAAIGPKWRLDAQINTNVAPGAVAHYYLQMTDVGDQKLDGKVQPFVLKGTLPAGFSFAGTALTNSSGAGLNCTASSGTSLQCTDSTDEILPPPGGHSLNRIYFRVDATVAANVPAGSQRIASFQVSGGGAPSGASSTTTVTIAAKEAPFGVAGFDAQLSQVDETAATEAGAHPFSASTEVEMNTVHNASPSVGDLTPAEPVKDIIVDLPPGFTGNPSAADQCAFGDLANALDLTPEALCPARSQVGTVLIHIAGGIGSAVPFVYGPVPLFNMVPPLGVPARLGFNALGTTVAVDAEVRMQEGSYRVVAAGRNVSEAIPIDGVKVNLWGVPADPSHDEERSCPGHRFVADGGPAALDPGCVPPYERPGPTAFLRNPTSCEGPQSTTTHADSWFHPGAELADGSPNLADSAWKSRTSVSHQPPGFPLPESKWGAPVGSTDCAAVPFTPDISLVPTTDRADSPTGLSVDLTVPQAGLTDPDAIAQSDLRTARVVLPAGMSVNPSSVNGLGACTSAQVDLDSNSPASCPDDSKIGTVEIETPLLDHPVGGGVYLAKQGDNPFGALLALYLAVDDPQTGVVLKLPGHVIAGPDGQLETVFSDQPQLPFESLHLELFGGTNAPLRTPAACGTFTSQATLSPWSGNAPVRKESSFQITSGPNGGPCPSGSFDPTLSAGTINPLAGSFSPFTLRLSREDGSQELGSLQATLPEGLLGKLAGVPYCSDATLASISEAEGTGAGQVASPSCPAASQVGTVTIGAGAGPNPFYTQLGRVYLAGPYKGASLSLAVVTPALAGPFDLGTVVVRNALRIDLESTQLTAVSDPLPTVLHGIPLDLRDLRVNIDRPGFTLNPTSCEPMAVTSTITSVAGKSANPSNGFQVGNCTRLGFKPKLAIRLTGPTARSGTPALTATVTYPKKGAYANIKRASVALPHSEFLDQAHIHAVCTNPQFAARACPKGSIYGYAEARSPLLDKPLKGPVYLRTPGHLLPDLVADLRGQIEVTLRGKIDTGHSGGIRTTFESAPDAPISSFTLRMKGGKKGLLENSEDICRKPQRAVVRFDAQNGKVADSNQPIGNSCGKKPADHKRHG